MKAWVCLMNGCCGCGKGYGSVGRFQQMVIAVVASIYDGLNMSEGYRDCGEGLW